MKVSRRKCLTTLAVSGVGVLAGCVSDEADDDSPQSQPQQDQWDDSGGGSGTGSTDSDGEVEPKQRATTTVRTSDFVLGDSVTALPDEQIPWALTEIENTSDVDHGRLQTELRFYDSNDSILEVRDGYVGYIPANTVWRDYTRYYTEAPDRLEYVETRVVSGDPVVDATQIEAATVISSGATVDAESGVDLAAEVDLQGASPDAVTLIGLFYDAQDQFRGTVSTFERNTAETVAMSTGSISIRTPPNLQNQQVDSYEIVVLDGFI